MSEEKSTERTSLENTSVNEKQFAGNNICDDKIILLIGDDRIICSKSQLLDESDYFTAMFRGSFVEKDLNTICLKGIDSCSMGNLIKLLSDRQYFSQCDDIYAVLSACRMFLFEKLEKWIISRLDEMLGLRNCLKMWVELQKLEIYPLCWKAKSMSLRNFREIKDNETIANLNLLEVSIYLGHVHLQCDTELNVFKAAMDWFEKYLKSNSQCDNEAIVLKQLISCINFKHASIIEIEEMKKFRTVEKYTDIANILECIGKLKSEGKIPEKGDNFSLLDSAAKMLLQSRSRYLPKYPCLLMKGNSVQCNSVYEVIYYDRTSKSFKHLVTMPPQKYSNLTGFGMQDYNINIFLFGGEFSMGKGSWNREVCSFDMEVGNMELKRSMPSPRRHFESCVCGDYLYVVGGTGLYRVHQDNMFWYSFREDVWSKEVVLPCSGRQIKCCHVNKQLFLFSVSDKCGFFFTHETALWKKVTVDDPKALIPVGFTPLSIFSYRDNLFMKGQQLVEFEVMPDRLRVLQVTHLPHLNDDDFIETVSNHNFVYTMYKNEGDGERKMFLESLNLDTLKIELIFEFTPKCSLSSMTDWKAQEAVKLFMCHNHNLVIDDKLVNLDLSNIL